MSCWSARSPASSFVPAEGWKAGNKPPDGMAELMTELGLY